MAKCSHCKNECARDADTCPRCGKKNPGKSALGIILFILFVLYLIGKNNH